MSFLQRNATEALIAVGLVIVIGLGLATQLQNTLLPKIDRPNIVLTTVWPGKTIDEIENTLVSPLESQLKDMPSLMGMQSQVYNGSAITSLEFQSGSDMKRVYFEILAKINQIPNWPTEVSLPTVANFSGGAGQTLASLFLFGYEEVSEEKLSEAFIRYVRPTLSKVPGVSGLEVANTTVDKRIDILFDPEKLIQLSLSIDEVVDKLEGLQDRSGGVIQLGSRDFAINFKGQKSVQELNSLILAVRGEKIVRLKDIAIVTVKPVRNWDYISLEGQQSLYMVAQPSEDINVLETIKAIKAEVASLNAGPLNDLGLQLSISRDDSRAISNALRLLSLSLVIGVLLASFVLLYFLKRPLFVVLITLSIPFSLAVVTLALYVTGLSFNVLTLAGMALSVGLILDGGIVIVENIERLRSRGSSSAESLSVGVREVHGSILSSTLSTIAVFIPLVFMYSIEGQILQGLAFVIAMALTASLIFALLILPLCISISYQMFGFKIETEVDSKNALRMVGIEKLAGNKPVCVALGVLCVPLALVGIWLLTPEIDILPNPKQNIVTSFIMFDEPKSADFVKHEVAQPIERRLKHDQANEYPNYLTYGMFCFSNYCLLYFYTDEGFDSEKFRQWIDSEIVTDTVGQRVFTSQGGLLRFALPDSGTSYIDLVGADYEGLKIAGHDILVRLREAFPGARIQAVTPFDDSVQRLDFKHREEAIAYLGLNQKKVQQYLEALTDGLYVDQFYYRGETIPLYLKSQRQDSVSAVLNAELLFSNGRRTVVRDVVQMERVAIPESLLRINGAKGVSLQVEAPKGIPMGSFIHEVKQKVKDVLDDTNYGEVFVSYRGSADRLQAFLQDFFIVVVFAFVILLLLVWLTLRSALLTLITSLSLIVPILGGMLSLQALSFWKEQNLDIITMMGFIILVGLAVNNTILISVRFQSELLTGYQPRMAILNAIGTRMRPILMSCGTSIFGMLPLLISTSASSEIYRGLAAVIVGGLTLTLLVTPYLMTALIDLTCVYLPKSWADSKHFDKFEKSPSSANREALVSKN